MSQWMTTPEPPPPSIAGRVSQEFAAAVEAFSTNGDVAALIATACSEENNARRTELIAGRRSRICELIDALSAEFAALAQDLGVEQWCLDPYSRYRERPLSIGYRKPRKSAKPRGVLGELAALAMSPTGALDADGPRPPAGLIPPSTGAAIAARFRGPSAQNSAYSVGMPGEESAELSNTSHVRVGQ